VPTGATTGNVVVTSGGVASGGATFTVSTSTGPAQITSPAPGSTLSASTVAVQWTGGVGVTEYWLYVGNSVGGNDLFSKGSGSGLTLTVPGLPTDGRILYMRLWSSTNGTWVSSDYSYRAPMAGASAVRAEMSTPAPGSTLTASTVTFQWSGGTGVTQYRLTVGTSTGASDLFNPAAGTALSATVTGLPVDGRSLSVRLWSLINGSWQFNDYTYTALSQGASATPAQMTSPAPSSTLTASTVTFQWTGGTGVAQYRLSVGITPGGNELFSQGGVTTALAATVPGLPTDGRTIYVRLWSSIGGAWQFNDYTFTARSTTTTTGPGQITTPPPSSTLTASTVTFQWTGGTGVTDYWLYVGTTAGGNDLSSQGTGTGLSATVAGLPTDGRALYVRLWSETGGNWTFHDYGYRAPTQGAMAVKAEMSTPAPGSTLTASTVTFGWTGGTGVTQYRLTLGTSAGASDLYATSVGTSLSATVAGLPSNGSTLFARLWSLINGAWVFNDYTYTASLSTTTGPGQITTPPPASTLTASTVTFQWTGGSGATDYWLYVGNTPQSNDVASVGAGATLSATVSGLPRDGRTLYVRLWSQINGTWEATDYSYVAPGP